MMNRITRKLIYDKFDGHCAYCGYEIEFDKFEVDHMIPKRMKYFIIDPNFNIDGIDNLFPACKVCNHYKRALDLETYRKEWVGKLHLRIKRIPKNPRTERGKRRKIYMERILNRYNISEDSPFCGKFYFETIKNIHKDHQ